MIAKLYIAFLCSLFLTAAGMWLYEFLHPVVEIKAFMMCWDGGTWSRCEPVCRLLNEKGEEVRGSNGTPICDLGSDTVTIPTK